MKKLLASSIAMTTLLSLGIPYSVLAEDMTQTQSETTTHYNSQTGGSASQTTTTTTTQSTTTQSDTSAANIQPGMSDLVLNNQFGYTQNEVIVGTTDGTSPMVLPNIHIGSANTTIKVLNPTSKPVQFSVPQLNMTSEIPANGVRVIQIDKVQTANLTPGQEVAYYINDSDGNQIASSNFINNQEIVSMIDINTQVASTEETTTTTASESKPTQRKSTVRGYW